MWFERDLGPFILRLRKNTIGFLGGPRQSGKSALLTRILDPSTRLIECDDLNVRSRLNQDPALYLGDLQQPLIIDEAQYCPNIFPELKLRVDRAKRESKVLPPIWVTGSNQTWMNDHLRESLSGRSEHFFLNTLSIHELHSHFSLDAFLLRGGWPELNASPEIDFRRFLDDYLRTFVERDIALASGVTKLGEFLQALRLLAARTGHLINSSELGGEIGVKGETFQAWIHILERNGLVSLVPAYSNNLNKRLIRSPKFFFNDVSLAVRLQGWQAVEPLLVSPLIGSLFETMVFGELLRAREHLGLPIEIFHYRNKEKEEIDFIIKGNSKKRGVQFIALESKFARQNIPGVSLPAKLQKDLNHPFEAWVVTLNPESYPIQRKLQHVPIMTLAETLRNWMEN
jgi:predicted AAA+ superfamily ATPase